MQENHENSASKESSGGDAQEEVFEEAPPRMGLFSYIWPTGRRLLSALGVQRCSIL